MFKKRYVAAAACALAMVGTANAVYVNHDGTGDLLIAPAYFIGGGLSTDLKVINTSSTQSVVAKVIFRHPVTSAEVMDFLIYLSPSDVWTATIECANADAAGTCTSSVVRSNDDSMQHVNSPDFPSAAKPGPVIIQNDATTGRMPLPNQGYIEVLMGSAYDIANDAGVFAPGVSKPKIYNRHLAAGPTVDASATPNVLTGTVTAKFGSSSATLPLLALADYDNKAKINANEDSGLDIEDQYTSAADVEEAIWANNFAIPYIAGPGKTTLATFTFPTKLTYRQMVGPVYVQDLQDPMGQYRFEEKTCLRNPVVFDNSERFLTPNISPLGIECLTEFQWLTFGNAPTDNVKTGEFTEGWARLNFRNATLALPQVAKPYQTTRAGRSGVPAIATYLTMEPGKINWAYATKN